jgi:hypothetical protein
MQVIQYSQYVPIFVRLYEVTGQNVNFVIRKEWLGQQLINIRKIYMWKTNQCKLITVNITCFVNTWCSRSKTHTNSNHD